MEFSLRQKAISGVGWSAFDNVAYFSVTFLVGIVIARLVTPEDFGLLGITAIFTTICNPIVTGSFSTALIHKTNVSENDYDTAFFLNLSTGIFLYVVLFFLAPHIASFFRKDMLIILIRVSSLNLIIGSLSIVQIARLSRQLNFKVQAKVTLISSIVGGAVGICLALFGFGVWALVAQSIANYVTKSFVFGFVCKWFPHFILKKDSFNYLLGFCWRLVIIDLINSIWSELNQVVVGRCYNASTLGQYSQSHKISYLFSGNLTSVIHRVTFPVLSSIRNDDNRMVMVYRKIVKITIFVTAIILSFVGSVSEPLLYCLIGPQWHEASTYLPVLCLTGIVLPLVVLNQSMLQVINRNDLFLGLTLTQKLLGLIPLALGVFIGIFPMLYSNLVIMMISYILYSYYSGVHVGYNLRMQIQDVFPSLCIAFIIAISVYFVKHLPISFWIVLPVQIIIGIVVFGVLCELLKLEEYQEIKNIIKSYFNKFEVAFLPNKK